MSSSERPASARPISLNSSRCRRIVALMPARDLLIMSRLNESRGCTRGST